MCSSDLLEQTIESVGDCRLVVVDPLSAYLQGIDANRNADVRALLAPLTQLAQKYREIGRASCRERV